MHRSFPSCDVIKITKLGVQEEFFVFGKNGLYCQLQLRLNYEHFSMQSFLAIEVMTPNGTEE